MSSQFRESRELKIVDLFMDFTIGASGAPTLKTNNSLGVKSITRNSAGNYTVVLTSTHVRALNIQETLLSTAPAAPIMAVASIANVNGSTAPLAQVSQSSFRTQRELPLILPQVKRSFLQCRSLNRPEPNP